jgi:hypothetical protein
MLNAFVLVGTMKRLAKLYAGDGSFLVRGVKSLYNRAERSKHSWRILELLGSQHNSGNRNTDFTRGAGSFIRSPEAAFSDTALNNDSATFRLVGA